MELKWCPIKDFYGYSVSNEGNIISKKTGNIMKTWVNQHGYEYIKLTKSNGQKKAFRVHRLVAEHFVDGDKTLQVDHIDRNRLNNHASNLRWSSIEENLSNRGDTNFIHNCICKCGLEVSYVRKLGVE